MTPSLQRWVLPLGLLVIAALVLGVFKVKDETGEARRTVRSLEAAVAQEKENAAVLRAEAQYLESPQRLEAETEPPAEPSSKDQTPETQ